MVLKRVSGPSLRSTRDYTVRDGGPICGYLCAPSHILGLPRAENKKIRSVDAALWMKLVQPLSLQRDVGTTCHASAFKFIVFIASSGCFGRKTDMKGNDEGVPRAAGPGHGPGVRLQRQAGTNACSCVDR